MARFDRAWRLYKRKNAWLSYVPSSFFYLNKKLSVYVCVQYMRARVTVRTDEPVSCRLTVSWKTPRGPLSVNVLNLRIFLFSCRGDSLCEYSGGMNPWRCPVPAVSGGAPAYRPRRPSPGPRAAAPPGSVRSRIDSEMASRVSIGSE